MLPNYKFFIYYFIVLTVGMFWYKNNSQNAYTHSNILNTEVFVDIDTNEPTNHFLGYTYFNNSVNLTLTNTNNSLKNEIKTFCDNSVVDLTQFEEKLGFFITQANLEFYLDD